MMKVIAMKKSLYFTKSEAEVEVKIIQEKIVKVMKENKEKNLKIINKKSNSDNNWPMLQEQRHYPKRLNNNKPRFRKFERTKTTKEKDQFDVGEINVNQQTVQMDNQNTIIVPETQGNNQLETNMSEKNGEISKNFLYNSQGATNSNQNNL